MHYILGYSTDRINEFLLILSLKGIARSHPNCVQQAHVITSAMLVLMSSLMDLTDATDLVYGCLFSFAFYLFSRKSNLVPTTKSDVKSKKFLLRKSASHEGDFLLVTMNWSKTIQYGERGYYKLLYFQYQIPFYVLCLLIKICVVKFRSNQMIHYFVFRMANM